MAIEWISEQRTELVQVYQNCKTADEPVLEAFSVYLLRMLNGLAQMESSKLYGYEDQILGKAMKLFCKHYVEQVNSVLGSDSESKKSIIEDIEDAISKISNAYKNIIDSTSNSDRQMLTSQAVETSIYDISPKLFATYSIILETLVRLFGKQGVYAFLLHPSLKSNIETTSLFNRREKEGKVVLIYIPENEIEKIGQIPMYLLHEAFHVLTREERNRKKRACNMELHLSNAISQLLFKNVNFDFIDSDEVKEDIKKKLMKRWFKTSERIQRLESEDGNSRTFYSKKVIQQICQNWRECLGGILVTLGKDLCQVLAEIEYREGSDPYIQLPLSEWEIQTNIVEILANNKVEQYANMYMRVYREAYADVACILMAGISPAAYEQAFKDPAIVGADNTEEQDIIRVLRVHTVAKAVAACSGVNHSNEWKEYSKNNDYEKCGIDKKEVTVAAKEQEERKGKKENDGIQIFKNDLELFEDIIVNGAQNLWEKLGKEKSGFDEFRNIVENLNLVDILNGRVNESLQKLKR